MENHTFWRIIMKNLLLTILGMIFLIPQLSFADEEAELIWRTERLGGNESISDVEISYTREVFFNVLDNIVQVRNIIDGEVIETMNFNEYFTAINGISLTNDDRFLAISGDNPNLIIWDLENNREYKKFSKVVFEGYPAERWKSVSITPDGTKVTAIAVLDFSATVTELVVFDIASGEVIFSENRNTDDKINEVQYSPKWGTTEFSPSGEYLVTELGVNWDHKNGQVVLDSVYVFNTNNYEIVGNLQNELDNRDISFSSFENVISSAYGGTLTIYNLETKESKSKTFNSYITGVAFSRQSKKLIHKIGQGKPYIFDYNLMDTIFSYSAFCLASEVTKDNKYIISNGNGSLSLIYANWDGLTNVKQLDKESITLYPNPSNSELNITLDVKNYGYFTYRIYDMNSHLIKTDNLGYMQSGNNIIKINVNSLIPQSYLLKITSEFESYNFKIVKE